MRTAAIRRSAGLWSRRSVLAALCALPAVAQKVPDVRVAGSGTEPAIAAAGSAVYITWLDYRSGSRDVRFNRSLDGGASWMTSDVRLDTDPVAESWNPQIAANGGEVHVLWEDWDEQGGSRLGFNRSLDWGASWLTSQLRIDAGPAGVGSIPRLAVAGTAVYAVWRASSGSGIYFNRSPARGAPGSWLAAALLLDTGREPRLVAQGSAVYVTFERDGNNGVWFNRSLDGGATWLPSSIRVDSGPGPDSALPQIAASGASVYVTWADNRDGHHDIYFNRSLDDGATWLVSDVRIDTDPPGNAFSFAQKIAVSGSAVYIAWQDHRSGRPKPYFNRSLDRGSSWLATDVRLDNDAIGAAHADGPEIAASGSTVHVTWRDDRDSSGPEYIDDIYFNRSLDRGTTWLGSDVRLDTDPAGTGNSGPARIAASGASVYVTWPDGRQAWRGPGIYFNIPFGFQSYGRGAAGSGGIVPQLTGTGYPTLGSTASVLAWSGLGGAAGVMVIGSGQQSKASLPFLGGTLLVHVDLAVPLVLGGTKGMPGVGSAALLLVIPSTPGLVGANLAFQALLVDAGAGGGVSMTNAVEMWIG